MLIWIKSKWLVLAGAVKARLVDDAKHLHKFYSTWAAGAGAVLLTVWPQIPDDVKAMLPGWLVKAAAYAVLIAVVAGAAVKQDFGAKRGGGYK